MTATAMTSTLLDGPKLSEFPVQHLADFSVDLHPAQMIPTKAGTRMTFIIKRATVEGPRLRGRFLPGGGDWLMVGEDSIGRIDVRATIQTDDGALIHYETRGLIKLPADGLERIGAGETIPFAESYVRTTPEFWTADERYEWLNEVVAVGYNEIGPDHIDYRVYRVL